MAAHQATHTGTKNQTQLDQEQTQLRPPALAASFLPHALHCPATGCSVELQQRAEMDTNPLGMA